jgi:hypothetical protein
VAACARLLGYLHWFHPADQAVERAIALVAGPEVPFRLRRRTRLAAGDAFMGQP